MQFNCSAVANCQPELDATDLRLLALLQEDCARTNQELAEKAHVSAATCLRRVRRLVAAGWIERQVAILAEDRWPGLSAVVEVTLDRQGAERYEEFEARLQAEPAVRQCYRIASGVDFVVMLRVPDMAAYHALVHRLFTATTNVRNLRVFFAQQRTKFEPGLSLPTS